MQILTRLATHLDTNTIKAIADANRDALGFLPAAKVREAINRQQTFVAIVQGEIVGFVIYRHRIRDQQTTLYDICVKQTWRKKGVGQALLTTLQTECKQKERALIQLKCPTSLPANLFYAKFGFDKVGVDAGKKQALNIWELPITLGAEEA
jgi:ribosomal protein S18 acetylase RimI-like enzyme